VELRPRKWLDPATLWSGSALSPPGRCLTTVRSEIGPVALPPMRQGAWGMVVLSAVAVLGGCLLDYPDSATGHDDGAEHRSGDRRY
jgi:hypothetical protein